MYLFYLYQVQTLHLQHEVPLAIWEVTTALVTLKSLQLGFMSID